MRGTRSWQSGHHRHPTFPHPPQFGGKSKSNPLQVHRFKRYDQGILFTLGIVRYLTEILHNLDGSRR